MHSALNRAQAVFGFFTTVALCVAGLVALTVPLFPTDSARADVALKSVQVAKGRPHYYSSRKEEYAQIRFDLDADLSSLFNWNTKQVFVYVIASYPSAEPADSREDLSRSESKSKPVRFSESVIWDTIIPASESEYSLSALCEKFFPAKKPKLGLSKKKVKNAGARSTRTGGSKDGNENTASGVLHLRNQKPKYQIGDITGRIAGKENVTLSVGWNVQPWVGMLWWSPGSGTVPHTEGHVGRSVGFNFPLLKGKSSNVEGV